MDRISGCGQGGELRLDRVVGQPSAGLASPWTWSTKESSASSISFLSARRSTPLRSSGCPGVQHQGVNRPPRIALARRWQPSSKHLPSLPLVVQTGVDPLLSLGARQCRRCEMSDRRVGKLGKVNVRRESIGKRHADLAQPQHRDADAGYVNAQEAVELECATTIADYVVARTYLANFFPAGPTTTEAVRGVGWASADSSWGSVKGTRCCASGSLTSWTLASADPVDLPEPRCSLTILVLVTVLVANANRSLACSGKN